MIIILLKLNFLFLVEIIMNINDFFFMELYNVKVKSVGSNIKIVDFGFLFNLFVIYDLSEGVDFNDCVILDFGNLIVSIILI